LNAIDITKEKDDYINSVEKALSDTVSSDKKVINILQLHNHFEPIDIISCEGNLKDINLVSEYKSFLT
jgi:hypothetical protein